MKNFILLGFALSLSFNAAAEEQVNKRLRELSVQDAPSQINTEGKLLEESKDMGVSRTYVNIMATGIGYVSSLGTRNLGRDEKELLLRLQELKKKPRFDHNDIQAYEKRVSRRLLKKRFVQAIPLLGPAWAIGDSGHTVLKSLDDGAIIQSNIGGKPSELKRNQMFGPINENAVIERPESAVRNPEATY